MEQAAHALESLVFLGDFHRFNGLTGSLGRVEMTGRGFACLEKMLRQAQHDKDLLYGIAALLPGFSIRLRSADSEDDIPALPA